MKVPGETFKMSEAQKKYYQEDLTKMIRDADEKIDLSVAAECFRDMLKDTGRTDGYGLWTVLINSYLENDDPAYRKGMDDTFSAIFHRPLSLLLERVYEMQERQEKEEGR